MSDLLTAKTNEADHMIAEQTLIQQLIAKNEQAFQHVVSKYQEMVGNVCYGFVQNQSDAEELVQDVFVEVYTSIHKFKGNSKLSTWLYRIAVNKSLNLIAKRKRKRRIQTVSTFFGFGEEKERDYADIHTHNPAEQLEDQEIKIALQTAIEKLPKSQQMAFVLRKYDNRSYVEIAEIMETTVSAVESLIHRASRNLKKNLAGFYRQYFQ